MSFNAFFRVFLRVFPLVATSPFFAAYGALVLLRFGAGVVARGVRSAFAFRRALRCPHGHEVPVRGRYACASCKAEFVGWIGRCPTCGGGADFTLCPTCKVGVRLPWESP